MALKLCDYAFCAIPAMGRGLLDAAITTFRSASRTDPVIDRGVDVARGHCIADAEEHNRLADCAPENVAAADQPLEVNRPAILRQRLQRQDRDRRAAVPCSTTAWSPAARRASHPGEIGASSCNQLLPSRRTE
jgi:hypothetical protein